jgi:hypothetical protein
MLGIRGWAITKCDRARILYQVRLLTVRHYAHAGGRW